MASSLASTQLSSVRPGAQSRPQLAPSSSARRGVVCAAGKQPNDGLQKVVGAVVAAQIALLPIGGSALAGVPQYEVALGEQLQREAREIDRKTDNLPSLPDVGKALNQQFGQNDPKDVGKAIDKATPGVDLTKNPQDLVKEAGKKINNAAPDLGANPFDDLAGKAKSAAGDVAGQAKSAAGGAQGSAKGAAGDISQAAKSAAGDAQGAAKGAARQLDQATPDLSANPFDDIAGKAKSAAGDVAGQAKSAAGGAQGSAKGAAGDISQAAKSAAGDAQGAAKGAARQLDQATPDLSANPFEDIAGQVKSAAGGAAGSAKSTAGDLQGNAKSAAGDVSQAAKSAAGEAQGAAKGAARQLS